MNYYDDLQRFKDKTSNQSYDFKDFSSLNVAHNNGNWTLINQLSSVSDESKLAIGGHVLLPQPQPISPNLFNIKESAAHPDIELNTKLDPTSLAPIMYDTAEQLASAHIPMTESTSDQKLSSVIQPETAEIKPVNYTRLFASKPCNVNLAAEKNQSLQALLKRIASCR